MDSRVPYELSEAGILDSPSFLQGFSPSLPLVFRATVKVVAPAMAWTTDTVVPEAVLCVLVGAAVAARGVVTVTVKRVIYT